MKKIILIFLIISFSGIILGQWEQTAGPQGSNILSFYSPDQKILFTGSFGNGIFESVNLGAKWINNSSGLFNANLLYVYSFTSDGNYLFAGTQNGVYRTPANIQSWVPSNSGIENTIVLALTFISKSTNNTKYLIAGTSNGIYISTNSGVNWSASSLTYWVSALAYKTKNGNSLFATTSGNGVYRSDDFGATWVNISSSLPASLLAEDVLVVDNKIIISTYQYGVYLSTNNGSSWTLINNGLPTNGSNPIDTRSLTFFDNNLYVGTNYGVYKSTNYGTKWTAVNTGLDVTKIYSFGYNLFAGTTYAIFASFDEGNSWEATIDGLSYLNVTSMAAKPNILFTGAYDLGVSYSDDNGDTWYPTNSIFGCDKVYSLGFKGNMLFAGSNFMIFRSSDNGNSWAQTGYNGARVISLASNSQYLFAGSRNTHSKPSGDIERSSDNGNNWTVLTSGVFNTPVFALAVNNTNIFAGTGNGVYRSTNNGNNWMLVNSGLSNTNVNFLTLSGTTIFAGTDGGVFRSKNNGASWTRFNTGLIDTTITGLVFTTNENRVFAATDSGIFYTTLTGTKWIRVNSGLKSLICLSLCTDNDFIYAGISGSGIFRYSLAKMQTDELLTNGLPNNFSLLQNYPNPFNPKTKIRYEIPPVGQSHAFDVRLIVFDAMGREIETLVNEKQFAGTYETTFNAVNYPSGVYYYKLIADSYSETKKMILLK